MTAHDWRPEFLRLLARGRPLAHAIRISGATPLAVQTARRLNDRFAEDMAAAELCGIAHRAGHRCDPKFAQLLVHAAQRAHEKPGTLMRRLLKRAETISTQRRAGISTRQPWHPRPMRDRHRSVA